MNLRHFLDQHIEQSLLSVGVPDSPALVKQSGRPEWGHYQANGVMGAAKKLGKNPREVAASLIAALDLNEIATASIAGPGFINLALEPAFIAKELSKMRQDPRLGIAKQKPKNIAIDYSSPNLAKEMHIGHLRSTAIGDAAVKLLEFLGHQVTRINHVGDWGAQFGSLLAYMERLKKAGEEVATELKDLEVFYQSASQLFKSDEMFANEARQFVIRLQGGDPECLRLWQQFIDESLNHCQATYDALDVSLKREDVYAESFYNEGLPLIVKALEAKGLIQESDGAQCVFLDEFIGKDGKPLPAIIRKSDGGYPYMATDLVSVRYRSEELKADQALYFVDGRQGLHLAQLFAISRAAGFISEAQEFRHVSFGTILNKAGKPLKTREGGVVKLADVVTESIARALLLVKQKAASLSPQEQQSVARIVGIGAIKYAELSRNRMTDYIFDWDTMLAFEGNTAPYLQYAYTRIKSIFRQDKIDADSLEGEFYWQLQASDAAESAQKFSQKFSLESSLELSLAVKLLQYVEAVESVPDDYQANLLCNYLFELAGQFMSFYEHCPVLKAEARVRLSRLMLCDLTAKVLQHGLSLLGVSTLEKM